MKQWTLFFLICAGRLMADGSDQYDMIVKDELIIPEPKGSIETDSKTEILINNDLDILPKDD